MDDVLVVATGVIMMMGLDRLVATTRLGRGIRAVAQDPETATLWASTWTGSSSTPS